MPSQGLNLCPSTPETPPILLHHSGNAYCFRIILWKPISSSLIKNSLEHCLDLHDFSRWTGKAQIQAAQQEHGSFLHFGLFLWLSMLQFHSFLGVFFVFFLMATPAAHGNSWPRGQISCRPTPQPQQHGIGPASVPMPQLVVLQNPSHTCDVCWTFVAAPDP